MNDYIERRIRIRAVQWDGADATLLDFLKLFPGCGFYLCAHDRSLAITSSWAGDELRLTRGDWLIMNEDRARVMPRAEFENRYEPA